MADKYEYEQRKKEKLEEVKARLDFGEARKKSTRAQESAYSEDSEAEDGAHPCTPIAVRKAQGIRKNHSESEDSEGGHWKSKSRRKKSSVEDDDLSQPWVCARLIRSRLGSVTSTSQKRSSENGEVGHANMFNSTLTGNARVWFDDLPPESIDSYND
ncbi:hypothetical protein Tco_0364300 [Tanacetum coccineum]